MRFGIVATGMVALVDCTMLVLCQMPSDWLCLWQRYFIFPREYNIGLPCRPVGLTKAKASEVHCQASLFISGCNVRWHFERHWVVCELMLEAVPLSWFSYLTRILLIVLCFYFPRVLFFFNTKMLLLCLGWGKPFLNLVFRPKLLSFFRMSTTGAIYYLKKTSHVSVGFLSLPAHQIGSVRGVLLHVSPWCQRNSQY